MWTGPWTCSPAEPGCRGISGGLGSPRLPAEVRLDLGEQPGQFLAFGGFETGEGVVLQVRPGPPDVGVQRTAVVGGLDQDGPAVVRVGAAAHVPGLFEALEHLGDGGGVEVDGLDQLGLAHRTGIPQAHHHGLLTRVDPEPPEQPARGDPVQPGDPGEGVADRAAEGRARQVGTGGVGGSGGLGLHRDSSGRRSGRSRCRVRRLSANFTLVGQVMGYGGAGSDNWPTI